MKTTTLEKRCSTLHDEWEQLLKDASFLVIEPQGEVWPVGSDAIYAVVEVQSAAEWCIVAHFPLKPSWIALGFELKDRDLALEALLQFKQSRPVFYRDDEETFELKGDAVAEIVEEIRQHVPNIDYIDLAKNRWWLSGKTYTEDERRH